MDRLRCVVERITYQNAENGYSVIKCRAKGFTDLITAVGNMADTHVGAVLTLQGQWKVDAKYGRQFSIESYEETLPATVYGIEKYLGSGLIRGIGPKYAKRIVATFGAETLNVIEEEPDRLIEVPGIGGRRVEQIKRAWTDQKEIKNIMLFLQGHDVSTAHATKIFKQYGAQSIEVVQENPYRLADDIWGIGFKTADTIAAKLGFEKDKYVRLRSGLLYTLNKLSEDGHCYYIISRCGLKIDRIFIVTHGPDEENPFVPVEITEQAKGFYRWINENIWELNRIQKQSDEVAVEPGNQCCTPYECWYIQSFFHLYDSLGLPIFPYWLRISRYPSPWKYCK